MLHDLGDEMRAGLSKMTSFNTYQFESLSFFRYYDFPRRFTGSHSGRAGTDCLMTTLSGLFNRREGYFGNLGRRNATNIVAKSYKTYTGLGWWNGSVSALDESNPGLIPGSGRDTLAGANMPLAPSGVTAGLL
jgi:hypothetical protein